MGDTTPAREAPAEHVDFGVDDTRIATLAATRQGRVSQRGFLYQAAYAVARLASMHTQKPNLSLSDIPVAVRYDWAEDLDEVVHEDRIVFTQCKHIDDIGQASKLAEVVFGFAPKFLWTAETKRERLRFRLVCTDARFANAGGLHALSASRAAADREKVFTYILHKLATTPTGDRINWQNDADTFGHARLAQSLWDYTEVLYVNGVARADERAGPLFVAEREALDLWICDHRIHGDWQKEALNAIRGLIHGNLVAFDPTTATDEPLSEELHRQFKDLATYPKTIDRHAVRRELASFRYAPTPCPKPRTITREYLREQASLNSPEFVARAPTWADVAHGPDRQTKFIERAQTDKLVARVREQLAANLCRPVVVIGPPGAGKTTLVRRVAARLVQEDGCVVIDPGLNRGAIQPDESDELDDALRVALDGGPQVILVLDDPFFEDSGWPQLMRRVQTLRVGILAASPTFLYERYAQGVSYVRFPMEPPTETERKDIKNAWQCDDSLVQGVDDFWILCMQVAEGRPSGEIIARLWRSLNHGREIAQGLTEDLTWEVVAFAVASFCSREASQGQACPEQILACILAKHGPPEGHIVAELARLKSERGWDLFRIVTNKRDNWNYQGALIGAAHIRLAEEAWKLRPPAIGEHNVQQWIAEASLKVPECISRVALLAGLLHTAGRQGLAEILVTAWAQDPPDDLRHLSALASMLTRFDCGDAATPLIEVLSARVERSDYGWLAVAALLRLRQPLTDNIEDIIAAADFSGAPLRAVRFFDELRQQRPAALRTCWNNLRSHLHDGELNPYLVTWLLEQEPDADGRRHEALRALVQDLVSWLARPDNADATDVRVKLIDLVQTLPYAGFEDVRHDVTIQTRKWLEEATVVGMSAVWTKYLHFLRWPCGKPEQPEHQHDLTDDWPALARDQIRALREWAVLRAWQWLCSSAGENSTDLRTQYLRFLWAMSQSEDSLHLRSTVATMTLAWLRERADDTYVRDVWGAFLGVLAADAPEQLPLDAVELWMSRVSERRLERADQAVVQELSRLLQRQTAVFAASQRGQEVGRLARDLVNQFWATPRK